MDRTHTRTRSWLLFVVHNRRRRRRVVFAFIQRQTISRRDDVGE